MFQEGDSEKNVLADTGRIDIAHPSHRHSILNYLGSVHELIPMFTVATP